MCNFGNGNRSVPHSYSLAKTQRRKERRRMNGGNGEWANGRRSSGARSFFATSRLCERLFLEGLNGYRERGMGLKTWGRDFQVSFCRCAFVLIRASRPDPARAAVRLPVAHASMCSFEVGLADRVADFSTLRKKIAGESPRRRSRTLNLEPGTWNLAVIRS